MKPRLFPPDLDRGQLWQLLCQRGLAAGPLPAPAMPASPWYVRLMLAAAGWIGAFFMLGFVGAAFAFLLKTSLAACLTGLICCAAAWLIYRTRGSGDFTSQFALVLSLTGQGLFIAGLSNALKGTSVSLFAAVVLFEAVLVWLIPNFIARLLSGLIAVAALALLFYELRMPGIASAVAAALMAKAWLAECEDSAYAAAADALWGPIGYAAALGLIMIDASLLGQYRNWWRGDAAGWMWRHAELAASALLLPVLVFTSLQILRSQDVHLKSRAGIAILAGVIVAGALSFFAHGLAGAVLILLLGFAAGNRVLTGIGLFALLGFASHYYYSLQASLLFKSALLFASGVTVLALRLLARRWLETEQADHG